MSINLSIKNVPEALAGKIRARAARNHRSLQGELMAIVDAAGRDERPAMNGEARQGWKSAAQLAAERRAIGPSGAPSRDLRRDGIPDAVDIVRADRDSR